MNSDVIDSVLVVVATVAGLCVVFHPRVMKSKLWRATVTPLASIIGSGFLVLGPILKHEFGGWGIGVMFGLCLAAYLLGHAIRYNIACYDAYEQESEDPPVWVQRLETVSGYALVLAYVISITYYLNLFGAFAVRLTPLNDQTYARIVTTAVMGFMVLFGWLRGFAALERIEEGTVGLKLAIIVGLLAGLVGFFTAHVVEGSLHFEVTPDLQWQSVAVALGLVITVQGFETSRYLGSEFDAATRIRTMRFSQWISSAVYLGYIGLVTICFTNDQVPKNETGVIGMTQLVSPLLPAMLVAAALAAQFSAAVADTGGCGGLAEEVTHKKVSARTSYLAIGVLGIGLTWVANVYSIISYASRAFALYYLIQCAIAAVFSRQGKSPSALRLLLYVGLAVFALLVVIFGRPAE